MARFASAASRPESATEPCSHTQAGTRLVRSPSPAARSPTPRHSNHTTRASTASPPTTEAHLMPALPAYPWPLKPFAAQHPVRGFLCDPRIAGGGRTFHFGIDIAAPAGTAVFAVAPGKVSYGSPGEVAANGGIVVVEANGRNFGYWHLAPSVRPGTC